MDHKIKKERAEDNIRNKTEDSDVEYAIQLNRWLLKPLGLWPLNSSSTKFDKLISVVSPPVCCSLLFTFIVPSFIEMCMSENLRARLEVLGPTSFSVMVAMKYIIFMTRGEELKTCIDIIINDWHNVRTKEEREIMIRNAGIARLFTIVCVFFMYFGGTFYSVFLPLITAKSLTYGTNLTIRILPFHCNLIYVDVHEPPIFEIVRIVQCVCSVILYSTTTGVCSLAAKFVMHACGQCQIVMLLLKNLIDGERDSSSLVKKELDLVIAQHLHVIRFVTRVEDLLNEICLVEFLGCTMNMCLLGYYVITEIEEADTARSLAFSALFLSFTFNIFIYCYIGQILTNHCHEIGEASYMIDWYRFPGSQARFLILLIGIANRPITLTAGKMVQLSFPCFGNGGPKLTNSILKSMSAHLKNEGYIKN